MKKNGLGHLEEEQKGEDVKLCDFLAKNSYIDKINDEEAFGAQDLPGILYVNDIHFVENSVSKGDMWSLFGDLGLMELGEVSGVSSPWGYMQELGEAYSLFTWKTPILGPSTI